MANSWRAAARRARSDLARLTDEGARKIGTKAAVLGTRAQKAKRYRTASALYRAALVTTSGELTHLQEATRANLEGVLFDRASALTSEGNYARALPLFEQCVALNALNGTEGNRRNLSTPYLLQVLARCHDRNGDLAHATRVFSQAAGQYEYLDQPAEELEVRFEIAQALLTATTNSNEASLREGALQAHADLYERAVELGDDAAQARAMERHGRLQMLLDNKGPNAVAHIQEAIERARELEQDDAVGHTIIHMQIALGDCFNYRDEPARALPILSDAMSKAKDQSGCFCPLLSLQEMARALEDLDDPHLAKGYLQEALAHCRSAGVEETGLEVRAKLGLVVAESGAVREGREEIEAALAVAEDRHRRSPTKVSEGALGEVLEIVGILHNNITNGFRSAVSAMELSVAIAERVGHRAQLVERQTNLAASLLNIGESEQAIAILRAALDNCKSTNLARREASAHALLAPNLFAIGETDAAIEHFEAATRIYRSRREYTHLIDALRSMAAARDLSPGQSAGYLAEAAWIAARTANPGAQVETLRRLAGLRRSIGLKGMAGDLYKQAIVVLESVRCKIGNPAGRAALLEANGELYADAATYAVGRSEKALAFRYAEAGRARLTLDRYLEDDASLIGDSELSRRRGELGDRIRSCAQDLERLDYEWLSNVRPEGLAAASKSDVPLEQASAELELRNLEAEWRRLDESIAESNPRFAARTRFGLDAIWTVPQIQKMLLGSKSALLEYVLADDACLLFCLTSDKFEVFRIPIGRSHLETMVGELCLGIDQVGNGYPYGHELYSLLVGPAAAMIAGKAEILISPDGCLHQLPFAVLLREDPGEDPETPVEKRPDYSYRWDQLPYFLSDAIQIRYIASATAEALLRVAQRSEEPVYEGRLLALAAPLESANGTSPPNLEPLPFVAEELAEIMQPFDQGQGVVCEPTPDGGPAATRESALARLGENAYRFVHLATHAQLDDRHPWHSALVFEPERHDETPGYVRASEAANLDVPSLCVTMSGCQTLGNNFAAGEGAVGLALGFRHAGARNVCASMWPVVDKATAALMSVFYRHLEGDKLPPSAALALAQRTMIGRGYHPHKWAAFGVYG